VGAVTATKDAENGAHVVLFTAATKFNLQTPSGRVLKQGTTGVAYSAGGLSFTIAAGGTPAVAGDTITITVVKNNVELPGVTWGIGGKDSNNATEIRIQ
jgi:L-serine deaminase